MDMEEFNKPNGPKEILGEVLAKTLPRALLLLALSYGLFYGLVSLMSWLSSHPVLYALP